MKSKVIAISVTIVVLLSIFAVVYICIIQEEGGTKYGPYIKDIVREYNNESDRELISKAEGIRPPDGQWWVFHGMDKVPDCVNNESIEYYSDLIDIIKENHGYRGLDIKKASFYYHASVSNISNDGRYNTTCENLIEVNLTMEFSWLCSPTHAKSFSHYRCVIFDPDHEVIEVLNDDVWPTIGVA